MPTPRTPVLVCIALLGFALGFSAPTARAQDVSRPVIDVGLVVSDLERSVQFYTDVLGMTKGRALDLDASFGERTGLTAARPFHIQALKFEDSPQATEWKLVQFETVPTQRENTSIHDHTGLQYVTVHVKALAPFLERIRAHDVPLLGETPIAIGGGNHFALIQDPDGTFIELIGPMQASE